MAEKKDKYLIKTNLPTIDIKGKPYVPVNERVKYLSQYEADNYCLTTEAEYHESLNSWVVKAMLTIGDKIYIGHGQEIMGSNSINKTSCLENAETSAVGRACAFAGIGVVDSIASADEVLKAVRRQDGVVKKDPVDERVELHIKKAKTVEELKKCEAHVSDVNSAAYNEKLKVLETPLTI